jgi:hypothetical protein
MHRSMALRELLAREARLSGVQGRPTQDADECDSTARTVWLAREGHHRPTCAVLPHDVGGEAFDER